MAGAIIERGTEELAKEVDKLATKAFEENNESAG